MHCMMLRTTLPSTYSLNETPGPVLGKGGLFYGKLIFLSFNLVLVQPEVLFCQCQSHLHFIICTQLYIICITGYKL